MNLEYVRVFHAIARCGSVTAGAEQLSTSQPAISRQLSRLERNLGVRLFDRLPRGVRLTRAGEILFARAQRIFAAESEAADAIAELRGLRAGSLRVGASLTIGSYLLPEVLAEFHETYPRIAIAMEIANSQEIEARLLAGELDLAFTEGLVDQANLEAVTFAHDELIAVAPPGHPILKYRSVSAARFCSLPLLMRESGSGTRAVIEKSLERRGIRPRPVLSLGSSEALKRAVRHGLGVAIMSHLAVREELLAGTLTRVVLKDLTIRRDLHRILPIGHSLSPAGEALWRLVMRRGRAYVDSTATGGTGAGEASG